MGLYALLQKTAAEVANAQKLATPSTAENKLSQEAPSREQPKEAPAEHGTGISGMQAWFKPKPHQEKAVRRLVENDGKMVMAHGMGSGKSLSSIYGFETLRQMGRAKKALVVTPAGLRENYLEGAVKKGSTGRGHIARRPDEIDPNADYNIISFETLLRDPTGIMQRSGADTLIVDEYHRIRNEQSATHDALFTARQFASNFIGLTASPINNRPEELGPLLSISENNPQLTRGQFKSKFVKTIGATETFTGSTRKLQGIRNPAEFAKSVYPKIDYASSEDLVGKEMPKKKVTNVYVPMSPEQYRLYHYALDKLGPVAQYVMKKDPHVTVGSEDQVFTQIGKARQIANAVHTARDDMTPEESAERTPKMRRIIGDTVKHLSEKPDNQVVLYSNMINGGVDTLSAGLRKAGIEHALFIGKGTEVGDNSVTETSRQQGVQDYKDKKLRAIIISGAGAEGLDLKDSTAFFAADGHFNPERILQAEARARRLGGQSHRPPEQREVDVRRYQSVIPQAAQPGMFMSMLGKDPEQTTDQWVYSTAAKKYTTNKQFYEVLRKPNKYIRKEVRPDGGVRYVYPEEVRQPNLFQRAMGAPMIKLEDP